MKYKASVKRLTLYVKVLYLQNFSKVLFHYLMLAIIFIVSPSLLSIALTLNVSFSASSAILIFVLFPMIFHLVALLYVSKSFAEFHDRKTSSLMLTVPASSLEKYVGIFLFHFLTHVVLITIILFVSQLLSRIITNAILGSYQNTIHSFLENPNSLKLSSENESMLSNVVWNAKNFFHTIIGRFGYFFLTALLFKKNQFIKAILILLALCTLPVIPMLILKNDSAAFQETMFILGSFLCIIIGYFRFSKIQYS